MLFAPLSGGIDSTVVACLLHKAIGNQLHCIFVDNGLLRQNEARKLPIHCVSIFSSILKLWTLRIIFFSLLEGVEDPEQKKKNYWPRLY